MGATNPTNAAPGTIRADLGLETGRNLVHGSDSTESAAREIAIFFPDGGVIDTSRDVDRWVFEEA
jgi:nucleoside-diphosphate kinase